MSVEKFFLDLRSKPLLACMTYLDQLMARKPFFKPDRTLLLALLIFPIIHFAATQLGLSFAFKDGVIAIWPSSGIFLAALLIFGYRIWPALAIADLIVEAIVYKSLFLAVVFTALDLWDAVITAFLIRQFIRSSYPLGSAQDVFKFVTLLLISPLVSGTLAGLTLCATGNAPWGSYIEVSWLWYTAIMFGELIVAPLLLAWSKWPIRVSPHLWKRAPEFMILVLSIIIISRIAFGGGYPIEYVALAVLIWAAFRFEQRESTVLVAIVSAIAIWATANGYGSFVRPSVTESLVLVQSFVGVIALSNLVLTAAMKENKQAALHLKYTNNELKQAINELQNTQAQMIQSEKMSSLGQLVAGVAHEINNPVNFIHGNLPYINTYAQDLLRIVQSYQQYYPNPPEGLQRELDTVEIDFLTEDLNKLLKSMKVGTERIREIVLSLRNFSRLDESEFKEVDIHEGIDNTLLILRYRLKARIERPEIVVTKDYGSLPLVQCYPGQLNQVFMNLIANAIDALEEADQGRSFQEISANPNQIAIATSLSPDRRWVTIRIKDNGSGIPDAIRQRIFDYLFTTKGVGKGTGLGLAIARQIVIEKHGGTLDVHSQPGEGAEFVITIPVRADYIRHSNC